MAIGGNGTKANPWTIGSSADLVAFAGSTSYWASGKYAKLTADIDMTDVSYTPIGNNTTKYQGNFDGDGHVVSNLTISAPSSNYQGLFGYPYGATIRNIECEGFTIDGYNRVGPLAGGPGSTTTISNCYTYDCTVSAVHNAGGVAGYPGSEGVLIQNCSAENCRMTSSSGNAGGLVGNQASACTLLNCYALNCTIVGVAYAGGIAGSIGSDSFVTNCYAYDCSVSGAYWNGGAAGNTNTSTWSNCAVYGGTYGGTFNGTGSPITTSCYTSSSAGVTSAVFHSRGFWDGTGVSGTTYLSWDFTTPVWYWDAKKKLPVLKEPVVTAPAFRTKVSGSWKDADKILVNVNSTWKEVSKAYVKVNGTWKEA